jgi:hypothetical protein
MSAAQVLQFENYVERQPSFQPPPVHQAEDRFVQPPLPKKGPRGITESHYATEHPSRAVPLHSSTKDLDQTYVIEDRAAVPRFIDEYHLRGLLLQARQHLNSIFGEDSMKTLSVVSDDEGFEELFCLVGVKGDMEHWRAALRRFDREWWLSHATQGTGRLNFDFKLL